MPYYEFVDTKILTDESWQELLDSKERPPIPEWIVPIVSGGKLSKPRVKDEH